MQCQLKQLGYNARALVVSKKE
jgi:putative two-component system protein, hydrogenase maturation factor HypX/HoxX